MRIAFISDIHSNIEAFDAVLDDIAKQRLKHIYCLGDIVGYGANPNEVVEKIRKLNIPCVQGNHDFAAPDLKDIDKFNPYAQEALRWTNKTLKTEHKEWLKKLPQKNTMTIAGKKFFMAHGSPDDPIWEYIFPTTPEARLKTFLQHGDIIALGHTHIPFVKKFGAKLVLTPGSVGQPRDGNPEASYAILDTELLSVTIPRVEYDIETAARKIISSKLPYYLGDRLHKGS